MSEPPYVTKVAAIHNLETGYDHWLDLKQRVSRTNGLDSHLNQLYADQSSYMDYHLEELHDSLGLIALTGIVDTEQIES